MFLIVYQRKNLKKDKPWDMQALLNVKLFGHLEMKRKKVRNVRNVKLRKRNNRPGVGQNQMFN